MYKIGQTQNAQAITPLAFVTTDNITVGAKDYSKLIVDTNAKAITVTLELDDLESLSINNISSGGNGTGNPVTVVLANGSFLNSGDTYASITQSGEEVTFSRYNTTYFYE